MNAIHRQSPPKYFCNGTVAVPFVTWAIASRIYPGIGPVRAGFDDPLFSLSLQIYLVCLSLTYLTCWYTTGRSDIRCTIERGTMLCAILLSLFAILFCFGLLPDGYEFTVPMMDGHYSLSSSQSVICTAIGSVNLAAMLDTAIQFIRSINYAVIDGERLLHQNLGVLSFNEHKCKDLKVEINPSFEGVWQDDSGAIRL